VSGSALSNSLGKLLVFWPALSRSGALITTKPISPVPISGNLAIVYNQTPLDAFDVRPLCSEAMVIVGPPDDTLLQDRGGQPLRIRDVAELPLIIPAFPHANRRVLEQAAVQHGVHLRIALEVDSVTLTKALVRRGLGYSLLTYTAIQEEVARGELRALPLERPAIRCTVSVATLREQRASRLVRTMAAVVGDKVYELATSGAWKGYVCWLGNTAQRGDDEAVAL